MKQEAESHAEEDKKKRESIDAKNQADSLVYSTEKFMTENKEKIKNKIQHERSKSSHYPRYLSKSLLEREQQFLEQLLDIGVSTVVSKLKM